MLWKKPTKNGRPNGTPTKNNPNKNYSLFNIHHSFFTATAGSHHGITLIALIITIILLLILAGVTLHFTLGENGILSLFDKDDIINIPLSHPLYRLSDAYTDKIVCQNDIWGIERNVGLKIFDGSEDWQPVKEGKFYNKNTTIFECTAPEKVLARSGLCTHFDVHSLESQLKNIYDGISFSENREKIYMRTMNVKNMSTIETLTGYLKAQYDAGTPVTFLYALEQSKFEPFDNTLQERLNHVDWDKVGFLDANVKINRMEEVELNPNLFTVKQTGNEIMN